MCSPFLKGLLLLGICVAIANAQQQKEFKVCADPMNLPFSNRSQEGFENQIAKLVAQELHAKLVYVWQRMGRGFVREYLNKSECDALIGIPSNYKVVLTTSPYYCSSYVYVSRRDHNLQTVGLNDPRLQSMKIGVQVLEENYAPPAQALARRGLQNQIIGFDTTGTDAGEIIDSVASGKIDLAIVWGPFAGYFARKYRDVLDLRPLEPISQSPSIPFTFSISMGVRKGNQSLRDSLEGIISRRAADIQQILSQYGVPILKSEAGVSTGS